MTDFDIALHALALSVDEGMEYDEYGDPLYDDPDIFDIEGLTVPLEEYEQPDFMGAGVPASMTWD
jgi:hypothetical protein